NVVVVPVQFVAARAVRRSSVSLIFRILLAKLSYPLPAAGMTYVLLLPVSVIVLVPPARLTLSPVPLMNTMWLPDVEVTVTWLALIVALVCVAGIAMEEGNGLVAVPAVGAHEAFGRVSPHQSLLLFSCQILPLT